MANVSRHTNCTQCLIGIMFRVHTSAVTEAAMARLYDTMSADKASAASNAQPMPNNAVKE